MEYVSTFDLFVIYTCTANVGVEVCIYENHQMRHLMILSHLR